MTNQYTTADIRGYINLCFELAWADCLPKEDLVSHLGDLVQVLERAKAIPDQLRTDWITCTRARLEKALSEYRPEEQRQQIIEPYYTEHKTSLPEHCGELEWINFLRLKYDLGKVTRPRRYDPETVEDVTIHLEYTCGNNFELTREIVRLFCPAAERETTGGFFVANVLPGVSQCWITKETKNDVTTRSVDGVTTGEWDEDSASEKMDDVDREYTLEDVKKIEPDILELLKKTPYHVRDVLLLRP